LSLVLDTSAVLAFLNRSDLGHLAVSEVILQEAGKLIIPVGILSEISYLVDARLGNRVFGLFFDDVVQENFSLDCGLDDLIDVQQLVKRYNDLPLGYADAVVISCAIRTTKRIVSLDRRHFAVVQRELGFELLP
jgi:predicted nucleic acid-binding protein